MTIIVDKRDTASDDGSDAGRRSCRVHQTDLIVKLKLEPICHPCPRLTGTMIKNVGRGCYIKPFLHIGERLVDEREERFIDGFTAVKPWVCDIASGFRIGNVAPDIYHDTIKIGLLQFCDGNISPLVLFAANPDNGLQIRDGTGVETFPGGGERRAGLVPSIQRARSKMLRDG